jgi:hypothetical protein
MKRFNLFIARFVAITLAAPALMFVQSSLATAAVAQDNAARKKVVEEREYQNPGETLRAARVLFVRSRSGFFNREAFEKEILQRSEKQKLELAITRDESRADLIVEVYRKRFSTRFVFSVIEPRTKQLLTSDKSSSLGGEIESDLANLLIKKIKAARQ